MTSTEVINIIQEKIKDEIFCKKEALKAIRFIRKHPNDFLKQNIPESWAYFWALHIGDREIMIDKIQSNEYAIIW